MNIYLSSNKGAKIITLIFVGSAILSYAYAISTGTYNGDFAGVPEELGILALTGVLILTIIPYAFGWYLYRFFKRKPLKRAVSKNYKSIPFIFFIAVIWFIFLLIKYDVGIMGRPIYDAPEIIKPLIQISNRINPFYLGVLFILTYRGTRRVLWFGILLMIILGIFRAGLGVFLYVGLSLLIRWHNQIRLYLCNNKIKTFALVLLFPFFVGQMYELRSSLRNEGREKAAITSPELVAEKFAGRLSSFSNSAYIFQEGDFFKSQVLHLPANYFLEQVVGGVFGVGFLPDVTPERLFYGADSSDVSFMLGLPGNLYFSWLISPYIFMLNVFVVLLMCITVFLVSRRLGISECNEFALLLLLYPLTSGVASEFSALIASLVSFWLIFQFISICQIPKGASLKHSNQSDRSFSNEQ